MIDLLVQTFRSPRIESTTHLVVMLAIARRCGDEKGVCFAKQATLAADTRLHQKTVGKVISELEAMDPPMIRRVKGGVDDSGRRSTDHLYICLEAVTLPRTGPDADGSPARGPGSPALPRQVAGDSLTGESGTPHKETLEETPEEADAREERELSDAKADGIDVDSAVEVIWTGVGDNGRRRSSKSKVKKALAAALARRPRTEPAEERLRRILMGVRAYLSHPDTARRAAGSSTAPTGPCRTTSGNRSWTMAGPAWRAVTGLSPIPPWAAPRSQALPCSATGW